MKAARATIAIVLLACGPRPVPAQDTPFEVHGRLFSIENGEHDPKALSSVSVTIAHLGASGLTDDRGQFRLRIPPRVRLEPGHEITVLVDSERYAVWSPIGGKVVITVDHTKDVEIRMLPKGSKLFWTHERIEEYVARFAGESARQLKEQPDAKADLSAHVLELARQYGFTEKDVRREIAKWIEAASNDVTDFRRRGLANFAKANFGDAARDFIEVAVRKEKQAADSHREGAAARALAGDSLYNKGDFPQALEQYQKAIKSLDTYRDNLGDLGVKVYPEYKADVADLALKAATARVSLGTQTAGPDGRRHLEEAVQAYERLIAETPRDVKGRNWAVIQNNLGIALVQQGVRLGGAEGARKLAEAAEAFTKALTIRTRDELPQDWAETQNNLGNDLEAQGERLGGAEGARKLAEAADAFGQALTVYTRSDLPQRWAMAQNNLGNALHAQGMRLGGAQGARKLGEAADAFTQALTVYTRDDLPQNWAATQNNLGAVLEAQGERLVGAPGARKLGEAADAFTQALTVRTRDDLPQDWAATQNNLGLVLAEQGKRLDGAEGARKLGEAVDAYRQALTVRTRDDLPQDWAMTQNNLGNALHAQGMLLGGAEGARKLDEAATAFTQALTVYTRTGVSQQWAATQNNLGNALAAQGMLLRGAEGARKLDEAAAAFTQALTVYTRDDLRRDWAATQNKLGAALAAQGLLLGGAPGARKLGEAADAFRQALTVYTRDDFPQDWAMTQNNLGLAVWAQGERLVGAPGARKLGEAVDAFTQALTVRTRDDFPNDWAMTQNNLGMTLQDLATAHGLPGCIEHVGRLTREPAIRDDPATLAPLQALAIVCHAGMGHDSEARRLLVELVALVERQPHDFRLAWNWKPLRDFITESKAEGIKVHRDPLLRLIDAVSRGDRAAILGGLEATRKVLAVRDQPSEKAPGH